jgi:hypothetical protein
MQIKSNIVKGFVGISKCMKVNDVPLLFLVTYMKYGCKNVEIDNLKVLFNVAYYITRKNKQFSVSS